MSWFFGGGGGGSNNSNRGNDSDSDNDIGIPSVNRDDDEIEDIDDEDVENTKVVPDFDPRALERGAKALREIDKSSNSKDVLKLALSQEKTKQYELRRQEQELTRQNLSHRERVMQQEHEKKMREQEFAQEQWKQRLDEEMRKKKALEEQTIQDKRRAQQEWLEKQKQLNEENLQRQKQIELEIEEQRRKTLEYSAKLQQDTEKIKAKAETEGKIEVERKNEDIHLRSQKERLEEERKTKLDVRKEELLAYRDFFNSFRELITDKDKLSIIGKAIVGITFGIYSSKQIVNITGRYIENHLGKPSLVRETSRWSYRDMLPNKSWINRIKNRNQQNSDELKGIILNPSLENKMKFVARSTKMTKKNKAPFRHLLVYGPPGTGKTLFARTLSRNSGLDYAVLTGGDFTQLGPQAVTELHKVFNWAESSRRGTILFIDEADAFLRKGREGDNMSEHMRNALSAFLYRTGTETKHFMIVLATNIPQTLDKAVLDRIDDVVEFPLPGYDERKRMLQHYFSTFIKDPKHTVPIKTVGFESDEDFWDRLANKTESFSGRQVAKYMIQVQHVCFSGMETELTPFLMEQVLETFLKSKSFGLE